jgi:hypothetical protein
MLKRVNENVGRRITSNLIIAYAVINTIIRIEIIRILAIRKAVNNSEGHSLHDPRIS